MGFINKEDIIAIEYDEMIFCSDCEEKFKCADDEKRIITASDIKDDQILTCDECGVVIYEG